MWLGKVFFYAADAVLATSISQASACHQKITIISCLVNDRDSKPQLSRSRQTIQSISSAKSIPVASETNLQIFLVSESNFHGLTIAVAINNGKHIILCKN